jgi:hypothetical protein
MGGAVEQVGDFFQDEIIDPIKDVGRDIDSFVRDEVPGGWLTVGAATGAGLLGSGALGGAAAEGAAATGAFDAGLGLDAMTGGAGLVGSGGATLTAAELAASNIDPAILETMSAEQVAQAGINSPYYAAAQSNIDPLLLEGMSAQQVAAAPVLTSAALTPASAVSSLGLKDAFDAMRLGRGLLGQPEPQRPNMMGSNQMPQGSVDYSQYLNLLAQRPRRADITSLLG